ncbi:MAG: hypothetical protein IJZ36_01465, partial [Bacilli bacterium]|nr:hypothetical protein [Bacilli bacterium]
ETKKKISESLKGNTHTEEEKEKILLSQPTRQEIYCIELDMTFSSLSQAERYIRSTFNIVFSRRTLTDKLKKENVVSYKEVLIDNVLTELHWKYI